MYIDNYSRKNPFHIKHSHKLPSGHAMLSTYIVYRQTVCIKERNNVQRLLKQLNCSIASSTSL